tara:strand:- start:3419 stop:4684 length:1266 start_codon:yes stop_codon:yes gene_type:complete
MFLRKSFVLSLIFFGLSTVVYPQLNEIGKFELESRKNRKVVIPFKMINNLIVIPLSINDSDTLHFVLDTGVASTLITELSEEDIVPLNYLRTVSISGLGEGESVSVYYSPENTIQIGKALGTRQDVLVMIEDVFHLSGLLGTEVNGLIGYSVFKNFIVELDYHLKRIILHDHDRYGKKYEEKKQSDKWSEIPLSLFRQKPYVDLEIEQKDGSRVDVKLLLDSGASHGMALYYTANDHIHLPENKIRSFLGNGISGEINGYLGRINSLMVDEHELYDVVASYPDEEGIKRALVFSERDGSIGADVLRRFKVFINYKEESMILRPSSGFKDNFTYNISGMEIATPYPDVPIFSVTHVRDSSLAHKADIRRGDILLNINRLGSQYYDLNKLNHLFQKDGQKIQFKILRDEETIKRELILKNELY